MRIIFLCNLCRVTFRNKSEEVSKEILQNFFFKIQQNLWIEEVIVRLNAISEEKNVTTTQVVQIEQKIEVPDEQKLTAS